MKIIAICQKFFPRPDFHKIHISLSAAYIRLKSPDKYKALSAFIIDYLQTGEATGIFISVPSQA